MIRTKDTALIEFPLEPCRGARLLAMAMRNLGPLPDRAQVVTEGRRRKGETSVHAAADANVARISVAVKHAFAMGRRAARWTKDPNRIASTIRRALTVTLPPVLLRTRIAGGRAGAAMLTKLLRNAELRAAKKTTGDKDIGPFTMKFDASNPEAAAWAREHGTELAKDLSDSARERIKEAIALSQETGEDPYDAILEAVGDDERAELIARTESMRAVHEGQREGWDQAVEEGLLTGDERRVWIVTDDEKLCPECEELDGETASLDGEYPGGYDGPPAHPNCRCTEGLAG